AGTEMLEAPAEGDRVQAGGGAPRKDDLVMVGAEEVGNTLPGRLVGVGCGHRELVGAAVDVGVGGASESIHRLEDLDRLLGRSAGVRGVDPGRGDGKGSSGEGEPGQAP